jgi:hypothetical protein
MIVPAQVTECDDKVLGDKMQEWNTIEKSDLDQDDTIFHPDDEIILDPKESLEAPIKRVYSRHASIDSRQASARVLKPKNGLLSNPSKKVSLQSNQEFVDSNLLPSRQIPLPYHPRTTVNLSRFPPAKPPSTQNPPTPVEHHPTLSVPTPQLSNTQSTTHHPFQKSPIVFLSSNPPLRCSTVNPLGH